MATKTLKTKLVTHIHTPVFWGSESTLASFLYVFSVVIYFPCVLIMVLFVVNICWKHYYTFSRGYRLTLFCSQKVPLSSLITYLLPFHTLRRKIGLKQFLKTSQYGSVGWVSGNVWLVGHKFHLEAPGSEIHIFQLTVPEAYWRVPREFPESFGLCSIPSPHGRLWDQRTGYPQTGFRT